MRLDGDRIEEITFEGQGCSISQAAVSMMTALVKGKDRSEAIGLADLFTDMMHDGEGASPDRSLGDLRALQGVAKFPVRIRCALLAFDALRKALSTESEIDEVEADEVKPGEMEAGEPRTDELETAPTGGAPQDPESRRETKH
jgi:NifU-like protein involved in Fe-S cluster formation